MNEVYTEKEILGDALNSEKNATTLYNLGANECVHDNLRETMLDLLAKEHDIQVAYYGGRFQALFSLKRDFFNSLSFPSLAFSLFCK